MIDLHIFLIIVIIALITGILRFLPFAVWNKNKNIPPIIEKFGRVLPYAIMGMLVVYCLKDINFVSVSEFVPQILSCCLVAVLYVWKRNTLISIIAGTVMYMFLIQFVF